MIVLHIFNILKPILKITFNYLGTLVGYLVPLSTPLPNASDYSMLLSIGVVFEYTVLYLVRLVLSLTSAPLSNSTLCLV